MSKKESRKKRGFALFTYLFGNRNNIDLLKEEQIMSPFRTVVRSYRSNKLSMAALILFVVILVAVFVLPVMYPVDLGYNEPTQQNLPPNRTLLSVAPDVKHNPLDLSVGSSFTAGLTQDGKFRIWGVTERFSMPNLMMNWPEEINHDTVFQKVAAGYDHILLLTEEGKLYGIGNNRLKQTRIPSELRRGNKVKDIQASYQFSIALLKDGTTMLIGNDSSVDYTDYHDYQGEIAEIAAGTSMVYGLTKKGEIAYLGTQPENSQPRIPEGKGFHSLAAGSKIFAAIDEAGKIHVWGNITSKGEGNVPEQSAPAKKVVAGQYHFLALLEDGSVIAWGANDLGQTKLGKAAEGKYKDIYAGYYQNYLVKEDGTVVGLGHKGYLLGTDDFGRDIFIRLMNGGRLTITIGSLAVLISTIIGTILGGISGYFGGRLDMLLQRFGEIVNSMPFLPTIIILNSIFGNKFTPTQRVYLIMVLLGLLSWVSLMRLVRAQVLSVREQEFITAANAMGIKRSAIVFKHIIPNVMSIIIVSATLGFAGSLLTEASLSFLGFGVQPPQPTWGNMLLGANDSTIISQFWWRWIYPAVILSVCVICINLIGTGLDDAIDPKSQER